MSFSELIFDLEADQDYSKHLKDEIINFISLNISAADLKT